MIPEKIPHEILPWSNKFAWQNISEQKKFEWWFVQRSIQIGNALERLKDARDQMLDKKKAQYV